jgi:hypothetical protein
MSNYRGPRTDARLPEEGESIVIVTLMISFKNRDNTRGIHIEKNIDLPFLPFIGLGLSGIVDKHHHEEYWPVEEVNYDTTTGQIICQIGEITLLDEDESTPLPERVDIYLEAGWTIKDQYEF